MSRKGRRYTAAQVAAWAEAYSQTRNIERVADLFRVNKTTVSKRLHAAGVVIKRGASPVERCPHCKQRMPKEMRG